MLKQKLHTWLPGIPLLPLGAVMVLLLSLTLAVRGLANLQEQTVQSLKEDLEIQRNLNPIAERLKLEQQELKRLLSSPKERVWAAPDRAATLIATLQEVLVFSGLSATSVLPDAESVGAMNNTIRIDIQTEGSVDNLRHFLLHLSNQPWVLGVKTIEIHATPSLPSIKIDLWGRLR